MKIYELKCNECGESWTLFENEYSAEKVRCPFCRSKDITVRAIR